MIIPATGSIEALIQTLNLILTRIEARIKALEDRVTRLEG